MLPLLMLVIALSAPKDLSGHTGTPVDGKVFVTGGSGLVNEGRYYKETWLVDPEGGVWEALPPAPVARAMAGAAELGGSIYVAGGCSWVTDTLTEVDRFDLPSRTWHKVAPLRVQRSRFCLVPMDGKLFAVSGMQAAADGDEPLNTSSIEEYDPTANKWHDAGHLRHARHGFAAIAYQGKIYVFGGNDGETERSAEVWDPETGRSRDLPNMPVKRGFGGVVQVGGRLVCFGGRSDTVHPSAFDPRTEKWSESGAPDPDRCRFVATTLGGRLWLVGGESRAPAPIIRSFSLAAW